MASIEALERRVEARDRDGDAGRAVLREIVEQVDVARHQLALGDDRDRIAELGKDLEAAAGEA